MPMSQIRFLILIVVFTPLMVGAQWAKFDFENYFGLPNGLGQWYNVNGVFNPSNNGLASPDYYHALGSASCDLPETPFAIVPAYSGQGMMGLALASTKGTNTREYLSVQFTEPLTIGAKYKISIPWTSGTPTPVSVSGLTISDLGVLLSSELPQQSGVSPIQLNPQFIFRQELYSTTWREATIEFVAESNDLFMTIGLFGSDDNKAIINRGNANSTMSYYFFDDIRVEKLMDSSDFVNPIINSGIEEVVEAVKADVIYVPNSFTPNEDGTNDAFLALDHEIQGWDLKIFNRWGQLIYHSKSAMQGWTASEVDNAVDAETFFWTLEYVNTKDIKESHRGNVYLIR